MTREEALKHLDLAIKQDRERFFRIADPLTLQPKYKDHMKELEDLKQEWRDLTKVEGYPDISFPPSLPEWFPEWHFMTIVKGETIAELIKPKGD